jgi:hypothetical protein
MLFTWINEFYADSKHVIMKQRAMPLEMGKVAPGPALNFFLNGTATGTYNFFSPGAGLGLRPKKTGLFMSKFH